MLYGIAAGRIKFIWGGERGLAAELGFKRKNNKGEKKGIASELRAKLVFCLIRVILLIL